MTLEDYISNINTSLVNYGGLDKPYPHEFLRRKINATRAWITEETRCLEHTYTSAGVKGQAEYSLPDNTLDVVDVWYDNRLLDYKNTSEMNWLRSDTVPESVPSVYAKYGSEGDPDQYIYLYPTPNEAKTLKVTVVMIAEELIVPTDEDVLKLSLQYLVEEGVKLTLQSDLPRTDPRLPVKLALWHKKVNKLKHGRVK